MRFSKPAGLDISLVIAAPPAVVFAAFFDHDALRAWWQVLRSVTTPRVLGPYVIEWPASAESDDLLGRLGGVFRGTIMNVEEERSFFVADTYWLPPDGNPIGPMALDVTFTEDTADDGQAGTRVRVVQNGFAESPRWRRYYEVIGVGWERALTSLKALLEN